MLYLARLETFFPADIDPTLRDDIVSREKAYGQQLQAAGKIAHLWRVVGPKLANLTMFDVESNEELQEILAALPMRSYMDIEVTPIARHPSVIHQAS
ncbi:muconolactone D-isomerase [Nocardioides aromaticivorans]|uniref:Muconolactone Delta-isomerase n=1 Tax=Nocardioides aromaticivorans TaxID=200618 RepID=A0A7Y9ZK95_9ACTN|nr:muconolactone D-isomerase [Nocardioides aromaticivorans]